MICNGIDTDQLAALGEIVVNDPDTAAVSARVRTRWEGRYGIRASGEEFHLGGRRFPRGATLTVDLPQALGGADRGPAPGELVLAALGSCVSQAFVEIAAMSNIHIDRLEMSVEGHLDLRGTAGVAGVRPGMSQIHLDVEVESAADEAVLDELLAAALQRSPVADSLAASVQIGAGVSQRHPA